MKNILCRFAAPLLFLVFFTLIACSEVLEDKAIEKDIIMLDVYKSRTCNCCQLWVRHMKNHGFNTSIHHPTDLNNVKVKLGVSPKFQSCHTATSQDGYVFEGHIPARIIREFLDNPPEGSIGLSVPGMPVGSPGMEVGEKFMPYQVWLLKKEGSPVVYASIEKPEQQ